MEYHVLKDVVNRYYAKRVGGDQRPVFFDIPSVYPALQHVTREFASIQTELDRLLDDSMLPRYHHVNRCEREISKAERNRSAWMLEILGHRPKWNRARCPATCAALSKVPNLIQAYFSILAPGKSIPEHQGPYLGYLRYHLALRVPTDKPPAIYVSDRRYEWSEGDAILFDHSWAHRVENESSQLRALLVVDVLRPMPRVPALLNRFTANVVIRHTYGRSVAKNVRQQAAA